MVKMFEQEERTLLGAIQRLPSSNETRVISYGLYGSDPKYTFGAIRNAEVITRSVPAAPPHHHLTTTTLPPPHHHRTAQQLPHHFATPSQLQLAKVFYPGWTARFYHSSEVPQPVLAELLRLGAELVPMGNNEGIAGMFWRFQVTNNTLKFAVCTCVRVVLWVHASHLTWTPPTLSLSLSLSLPLSPRTTPYYLRTINHKVASDPAVDRYLVRDTDSRLSARERFAVEQWVQSGTALHTMRDHPKHRPMPIMGGCWGGRRVISGESYGRVPIYIYKACSTSVPTLHSVPTNLHFCLKKKCTQGAFETER